jgi:pimeloyl-ACP methyl ester carboxylesterase
LLVTAAAFAAPPLLWAQEPKPAPELKKVTVADGVTLHYVEKGKGTPIVFIHGGGFDYETWGGHLGPFAEHYRAIAYSCRYTYPNTNKVQPNYSLIVAAEDLAGLIQKLDLRKVHVVGYSIGGQTALFLALKHPELVRTLTLCDPAVHFKGDKFGEVALPAIQSARAAYEKGKPEEAAEAIAEVPAGRKRKIAELPEAFKKILTRNAGEIEALVKGDMFPEVDRAAVKKIEAPVLLMFGGKSAPIFKSIEEELTKTLPEKNRKLIIFQGGNHGFVMTHAKEFQKEVLEFLKDK